MPAPSASSPAPASCPPPWRDLPPDLLGQVIAHLPFPADRARFRAVCRAWHGAAREHVRQFPWVVLPDGSFCTLGAGAGADDGGGVFFPRLPGLPEAATCLGATGAGGWLALDRTDAAHRRTSLLDKILSDTMKPPGDVKHRHAYLLHNPFTNATVPLPELDAIAGDVPGTFEIRKVLMRSSCPDDVVAVTTNSRKYLVVVLRPGKGASVLLPYRCIFDVAFLRLYGITLVGDLVAFDLAEDCSGRPIVDGYTRVVTHTSANGEEDEWGWVEEDNSDGDDEDGDDSSGDEASDDEIEDSDDENEEEEELSSDNEGEKELGGEPNQIEEDAFNSYYVDVPDGSFMVEVVEGEDVPDDEPKVQIMTTRYLVTSSCGKELLMVRHRLQRTPLSAYTREVEIFRADLDLGRWVPVTSGGLTAGEALFLSRSSSKSTLMYGGIGEGLVYFVECLDDVFDTRSWTTRT